MSSAEVLDRGTLSFSIEGRILRELGERLVKQPEVAVVELVKNAYDADATECTISYDTAGFIRVEDDGNGMTLDRFKSGWMRIGTSSKEATVKTGFGRQITGEKGIGRFAVRFLGRALHLESVADDARRRRRTRLIADFDWPEFDRNEDLGNVQVPYRLEAAAPDVECGTILKITRLRNEVTRLDLQKVRTGTVGILTPLRSLFRQIAEGEDLAGATDPGFTLNVQQGEEEPEDVAAAILESYVFRALVRLEGRKLDLRIYQRGLAKPYLKIVETYPNQLGKLYADIRFFPGRAGVFRNMPVDGRLAKSWLSNNAGVAVFDRNFRVQPYGTSSDDWLELQKDNARNRREPRSQIAKKHFPMSAQVRSSTSENWMLRLPQSAQLVGVVQVEGRRNGDSRSRDDEGLVASADREGFVENEAFMQLRDVIRGAVEAIGYADRQVQLAEEKSERDALVASIRKETRSAIDEVQSNPNIGSRDKAKIVAALAQTQQLSEKQEEASRERERQLEVMSLLGVVAGFMTHEFGAALHDLEEVHNELTSLARRQPRFKGIAESVAARIKSLKDFVTYSSGYIQGTKVTPAKPYPARPRLQQVKRIFGRYAEERNILVEIDCEADLLAPLVPASLYNGLALNLFTNALKAVTAKAGREQGVISFRSWNDSRSHYLEVSDTGIGIPSALHERVFDPLFTTTASQNDPLGSGMGLGLALVRRGAEAFGGSADVVEPPPTFATCVRVKLPL
ncbi:signal transduction histidine kinase [Bradyrhizobium sp. USDA 4518]